MLGLNNYGEELDVDGLVDEFYLLNSTEYLAGKYEISEEQVFAEIGGKARVETENSSYVFDFANNPATVTRILGTTADVLRNDDEPVTLVSIINWKPFLTMYLDLRGDGILTLRTTSDVKHIYFY